MTGLLKPLDVFCSQSQSQRYIKTVRNLGDAWRSLADNPLTESDKNSVLVETNFDFVLKITNALEGQQSEPTTVEMSTHEPPFSTTSISTTTSTPTESPRHYRIFADYGTDFIWRDPDDLRSEEGDCMLEAEEVLSSFPPSVLESHDAWVDTYTDNFKESRTRLKTTMPLSFRLPPRRSLGTWLGFCWRGALQWRLRLGGSSSALAAQSTFLREGRRRVLL